MKHVLVTGGAGYVGAVLIPKLLTAGYMVSVYDWYLYHPTVFSDLWNHPNLKEIKADLRDIKTLKLALKDVDTVIHLACISNDPSFDLNPDLGKSINFGATIKLIDLAKQTGVKLFIYASSSSVYGIQEGEVREDTAPAPLTDYARYKYACEEILRDSGLPYVAVRPGTISGYAPRLRLDLTINLLTACAIEKKIITVHGGSQLRPHITMSDIVRLYAQLLTEPIERISGQVFNAGFWNLSISDTADLIKKTLKNPKVVIKCTMSTIDTRSYKLNSEKIKKVLGFKPRSSLSVAIKSIQEAFRQNLIVGGIDNPFYHNVKLMKLINLS